MNLQYSTMEKMVGAFVLLTLLISVFTLAMVGRGKNWFRKHVTYYTTFKEGYNLASGSRVKLFGTDIGQVTDVELTEDNQVRVEFKILAEYSTRVRADSEAVVESPTFIGSEFIALTPGSKDAPPIPPDGEVPSAERKKLTDYLEEYQVEKKIGLFGKIVEDLSRITGQLKQTDGPLFGTLGNIQQLTGTIDEGRGTLGRMIRGEELYEKIMAELDALDAVLTSLKETADQGTRVGTQMVKVSENMESATRPAPEMIAQVQDLLDRLLRVTTLMERAMTEVPEISRRAREGMREVNRILDSVQKNFLIRPNLPPEPTPESHGLELRGD